MVASTRPDGQKDRQFVTALARGLEILRCFTAATPSLGTAEIARMTGMPQPTVWRLCHTLIKEGYLVQLEHKDKLRPGVPILSLGYSAIVSMPVTELAHGKMNDIAVRYQGTVSLGVRDGADMVYIQRCLGSQIILRDLVVGSRVPILTSATGWAYLAGLDEKRRKEIFAELKKLDPAHYRQMGSKFQAAMEAYAVNGYLVNKASLHPQINAVSVPVVSGDGTKVMGLSSGGIAQLFDDDKLASLAKELKVLATEISTALTAQRSLG